jgi:VWFA-related protein
MRRLTRKTILLAILFVFTFGWVILMSLGTTTRPGVVTGPDGSTASVTLIDADSAFPTINTHVLVRDGTGQPVRGLGQEVFELTEDGIPVRITGFLGAGEQAVTAVLVIDHSGSMEGSKMAGAQEAAKVFVSMTREDMDSLGILVFDDVIDTLSTLKPVNRADRDALMRQIDAVRPGGGTAFHDAVYAAVEQLQGASGRTVVVALTDGKDNKSRRSVDQVITFAKSNHAPVYTIGLGRGGDIDVGRLRKLAQETGGEFHQTPTADQLAELYRKIAEELQNEYVISYTSPTPELDGTRREVVVNLEHAGGALSTSGPYAVGGIIKSSINYPFFGALLLLLLVLLALPSAFRRIYARRPAPEVVVPAPPTPVSDVAPPPGPAPQPVTPMSPPRPALASLVTRLSITKETVSLGSTEGNDIIIPVPMVAAQHARISLESGRYVITDLSQGHTAVSFSGDPAQLRLSARNALKDGSLVKLGEAILVFRQPAQGSPWLEMVYEMTKAIVTVGSEAGHDIVLTHPSVSPRHAELRQEAGRWVVRDLDSAQGTFVSYSGDPAQGRKVSINALKTGSIVRFGQVSFVFKSE